MSAVTQLPDPSIPCDECGEQTTDPTTCEHGREQCPECVETFACRQCAREALSEAGAA